MTPEYRNDDMTFCSKRTCRIMSCDRNPKHIMYPEYPHSYSDFEGTQYCMKKKKFTPPSKPLIDPADDDFGAILVCAERYSIGRQSYMPSLVIAFIRPLLPHLNDKTLHNLESDIRKADNYGHETIDKPEWLRFLSDIQQEQQRRKEK